jgi:hypothetical protein
MQRLIGIGDRDEKLRVIQEINDPKCWDNGEIIDVPSIPCLQNLRSNSLKA